MARFDNTPSLIDSLCHAGLAFMHREGNETVIWDLLPPQDMLSGDTRTWANEIAAFMEQRGWNAVAAPKWEE